jgi:hypothetical protein
MAGATKSREDRIRESAYHLWESEGRPIGRDEEFWHRASGMLADDAIGHPAKTRSKAHSETNRSSTKARSRRVDASRVTSGAAAYVP